MRSQLRLGFVNLALVSLYFVPVWGHDAVTVLTSPFSGFENPAFTAAAVYIREVLNLGLAGLIRTAAILAVVKLVIAVAFLAYLIEFARALATGREVNRETVDVVLLLALTVIGFWMVPALTNGDAQLVREQATQFMLLVGAAIVITLDRQDDRRDEERAPATRPLADAAAAGPLAQAAQPLALSSSFTISPASLKAWFAAGTPQ
jgi:undecaprenyl pyrophosphate phosphatase UppP